MSSPPTGLLFYEGRAKPLSTIGGIQPGAYYQFYLTSTTTPATVYADGGLVTPLSQTPGTGGTTAASDGRLVPIYLNPAVIYRYQLYSSAGVLLEDTDPYVPGTAQTAIGPSLYPQTTAETNAGVTIVNFIYPPGDLRRYGGDPTNSTDSSTAFQAAILVSSQTNGNVPAYVPGGCAFKINAGYTYTGSNPITIRGDGPSSQLFCDANVLTATGGASGSQVTNLALYNITAPWIITRNPSNWAASMTGTLQQSNTVLGYQPTANDIDIWSSLTTAQQNQNIGPIISFSGISTNIKVSKIYGRFVGINISDSSYSSINDCNFRGGKQYEGGINFDNHTNAGTGNQANSNIVEYASYCGINWNGNLHFECVGNVCARCGESGIKTEQFDGVHPTASCFYGVITGNKTHENYYDGLDCMSIFPQAGDGSSDTVLTYHTVSGNQTHNNGGDGINADGQGNTIVGNTISKNYRFGLWAPGLSNSLVEGNTCIDNNTSRDSFQAEMLISGKTGQNLIKGNRIFSGSGQNSSAIATCQGNTSLQYAIGNYATGSSFYFGNQGVQPCIEADNVDSTTISLEEQWFTVELFSNGGTLQHAIWADATNQIIGWGQARINASSLTLTNTPTGANASTAFATGVKVNSAATNQLIFDVPNQNIGWSQGVAAIGFNSTGNANASVRVGFATVNVNGVTRLRMTWDFYTAGSALNLTTLPASSSMEIQFRGKLM